MGLNIMGFTTSITTNALTEIAKKINIKISEQFGTWTLEEAMPDIEDNEICIAETRNGSLILVGNDFPIYEVRLKQLSDNGNKVLRFLYGETSMYFFFEYTENGKILRRKLVEDGEVNSEEGKALDIEFSGIKIEEIIPKLLLQVSGDDIYTLEPDHKVVRYRYLGKIENVENSSIMENKNQENQNTKKKPWWKFGQ